MFFKSAIGLFSFCMHACACMCVCVRTHVHVSCCMCGHVSYCMCGHAFAYICTCNFSCCLQMPSTLVLIQRLSHGMDLADLARICLSLTSPSAGMKGTCHQPFYVSPEIELRSSHSERRTKPQFSDQSSLRDNST